MLSVGSSLAGGIPAISRSLNNATTPDAEACRTARGAARTMDRTDAPTRTSLYHRPGLDRRNTPISATPANQLPGDGVEPIAAHERTERARREAREASPQTQHRPLHGPRGPDGQHEAAGYDLRDGCIRSSTRPR